MNLLKKLNNENLGIIIAIASSLFISIEILVIDYLYKNNPNINFFEMLVWSYFGVVLFGSLIFLRSKKSLLEAKKTFKSHNKLLIKDSLISVIAVSFYFLGIAIIGSASTSILVRSSIVFSILLGVLLLKEKISKRETFLISLMILGFLIYQEDYTFNSILGVFMILFSTFLYSLISYYIKKENNGGNSFYYAYLRQIIILIFSILLFIIILHQFLELNFIGFNNFLILTLGSFFGGILSRATTMIALNKIDLTKFSILRNLDIFFTMIGTYLIFFETYSYIKILGVVLVFISIIIYALGEKNNFKVKEK